MSNKLELCQSCAANVFVPKFCEFLQNTKALAHESGMRKEELKNNNTSEGKVARAMVIIGSEQAYMTELIEAKERGCPHA